MYIFYNCQVTIKYIPNSPVSTSSSFFKFSACKSVNTKMGLGKKDNLNRSLKFKLGRHYGVVESAVVSEATGFKLTPLRSYVTFHRQIRGH